MKEMMVEKSAMKDRKIAAIAIWRTDGRVAEGGVS